jgi:hypothetical protein
MGDPTQENDLLLLADYGTQVLMLQTALSQLETLASLVPRLIAGMARDGSWRRFTTTRAPGQVLEWSAADFRRFLEAPRPAGCQSKIELVERMLRDTPAWEAFLELTRGERD